MNKILQIFQVVGIITIVYLIYTYYFLPKAEKKKQLQLYQDEKIRILFRHHPLLIRMFEDFKNHQRELEKQEKDENYGISESGFVKIFGNNTYVNKLYFATGFEKQIIIKIEELEKDKYDKMEIDDILEKYQQNLLIQNQRQKLIDIELKFNYLKYNGIVKEIFPTTNIKLEKIDLVNLLSKKLNTEYSEAEKIVDQISKMETGIISKYPDKFIGEKTYLYFYNEALLKDKI
ncbi:MAG TPA: hypothetical protein PLB11_05455 [Flavobacterium sp.]|nr:hypothetical protein [Flavobacterium sp.]